MLNNNVFPFFNYLFTEFSQLENFIVNYNSKNFDLVSGIDGYFDYLFVHFTHDVHSVYMNSAINTNSFFRDLIKEINITTVNYNNFINSLSLDEGYQYVVKQLLTLNDRFLKYLSDEFGDEFEFLKIVTSVEDVDNLAIWRDVFKEEDKFKMFEFYIGNHIVHEYLDLSYLYNRLKNHGYIHRLKHKEFASWLLENEFISANVFRVIDEKNQFASLSNCTAEYRVHNFNQVFGF